MPREPRAHLHDIRRAAALIAEFTDGLDFDAYATDAMVRAAVVGGVSLGGPADGHSTQSWGQRTRIQSPLAPSPLFPTMRRTSARGTRGSRHRSACC